MIDFAFIILGAVFGGIIVWAWLRTNSKQMNSNDSLFQIPLKDLEHLTHSGQFAIIINKRKIILSKEAQLISKVSNDLGLIAFCESITLGNKEKSNDLLAFLEKITHQAKIKHYILNLEESKKRFGFFVDLEASTKTHIYGMLRDFSYDLEKDEKITQLENHLQYASKLGALGDITSEMIKSINSPLTLISTNLKKVEKAIPTSPENAIHQQSIEKITTNLQRIYSSLKAIDKLDFLKRKDKFDKVDLLPMIQQTVNRLNPELYEKGIEIRAPQTKDSFKVMIKSMQFSVVLYELISNSIDAIKNLPLENERWIEIQLQRDDKNVQLRVIDSGPGFSEDGKLHLFEPLYSTKEDVKGAGMGLSIAKAIVEYNAGKISFESDYGATCFLIELPLAQD